MSKNTKPRVGVGVLVVRPDQKVLFGKRKGDHEGGFYSMPGGSVELGERLEKACVREVAEETGLVVETPKLITFTQDFMGDEGGHWITFWYLVKVPADAEPKNIEPDKCEGWEWFSWNDKPEPLALWERNLPKDLKIEDYL